MTRDLLTVLCGFPKLARTMPFGLTERAVMLVKPSRDKMLFHLLTVQLKRLCKVETIAFCAVSKVGVLMIDKPLYPNAHKTHLLWFGRLWRAFHLARYMSRHAKKALLF